MATGGEPVQEVATGGEPDDIVFELAPKIWTTRIGSKSVNLERFAYDMFVISAIVFGVPVSCIKKSRYKMNDYGHPDFLLVVPRLIFRHQIVLRTKWNEDFQRLIFTDNLASLETLQNVFKMWNCLLGARKGSDSIRILLTLAFTSEAILFLYSKDFFNVANLAHMWSNWIFLNKRKFRESGGLDEWYRLGKTSEYYCDDDLNACFIPARCVPYTESAKNPLLYKEWIFVQKEFRKTARINGVPPPNTEGGQHDFRSNISQSVKQLWFNIVKAAPEKAAYLTVKPVPCEDPTKHREGLFSSSPGAEQPVQQTSLNASGVEKSSKNQPGVSGIGDATSQELHGARSKNLGKQPQGSSVETEGHTESGEKQAKEGTSSDSSENEQLGENDFAVSGIPEEKSTQKISEPSSQEPTESSKSSSQGKWQKKKPKKKKSRSRSKGKK